MNRTALALVALFLLTPAASPVSFDANEALIRSLTVEDSYYDIGCLRSNQVCTLDPILTDIDGRLGSSDDGRIWQLVFPVGAPTGVWVEAESTAGTTINVDGGRLIKRDFINDQLIIYAPDPTTDDSHINGLTLAIEAQRPEPIASGSLEGAALEGASFLVAYGDEVMKWDEISSGWGLAYQMPAGTFYTDFDGTNIATNLGIYDFSDWNNPTFTPFNKNSFPVKVSGDLALVEQDIWQRINGQWQESPYPLASALTDDSIDVAIELLEPDGATNSILIDTTAVTSHHMVIRLINEEWRPVYLIEGSAGVGGYTMHNGYIGGLGAVNTPKFNLAPEILLIQGDLTSSPSGSGYYTSQVDWTLHTCYSWFHDTPNADELSSQSPITLWYASETKPVVGQEAFTGTPTSYGSSLVQALGHNPLASCTQPTGEASWTPDGPGDWWITAISGNDGVTAFTTHYYASTLSVPDNNNGQVANVAPDVVTGLNCDKSTIGNNVANTETCTLRIYEPNTEVDFATATISSDAGWSSTITDFSAGTRNTLEGDWIITDSTPDDGVLDITFTHEWPQGYAAGTYTQSLSVSDEAETAFGETDVTQVNNVAQVVIDATLYDATGTASNGNWGKWTTAAGATNVDSLNYLHATNPGGDDGNVVVNFVDTAFTGPGGATFDVDNNVAYCSGTGATPAADMTCGTTSSDTQLMFTVPAGGEIWIGYRIATLPNELPDGTYTATYTFTGV